MDTLIKLNNLTKSFENDKGIKNLSFSLPKNKIIGFIGSNGAGKTTTLKCILGEYGIKSGDIEYAKDMGENPIRNIGFFPDQNNFPKSFNIIEYAMYCASLKGIPTKEAKETIDKWVKILSLEEWTKNTFKQLSTGLQKKALLLSVLIGEPKLIILDEPTANLDIHARNDFFDILKTIHSELKVDLIITSHILDELENIIEYVVIIDEGKSFYSDDYSKSDIRLTDLYNKFIKRENHLDLSSIKGVKND